MKPENNLALEISTQHRVSLIDTNRILRVSNNSANTLVTNDLNFLPHIRKNMSTQYSYVFVELGHPIHWHNSMSATKVNAFGTVCTVFIVLMSTTTGKP